MDVQKVTPGMYAGVDSVETANANANGEDLTLRTLVLGDEQWRESCANLDYSETKTCNI